MSFSAATATLIEQPALRADEQVIVMSGPYGDKEIGARIAEARTVEGLSQEGLGNLMRPRRSQGLVAPPPEPAIPHPNGNPMAILRVPRAPVVDSACGSGVATMAIENARHCTECGAQLPAPAKFCASCGTAAPAPAAADAPTRAGWSPGGLVALGILGAFFAVVVGVVLFFPDQDELSASGGMWGARFDAALRQPYSPEAQGELNDTCISAREWHSTPRHSDVTADWELLSGICDTGLSGDDWIGARERLLEVW